MKTKPIPEEIREYISYNPETGELAWTNKAYHSGSIGKKVGTRKPSGYLHLIFKHNEYRAHRVAYFIHFGIDPGEMVVDHINGDKADNRIKNLRMVTHQQNLWHQPKARGTAKIGNRWHSSLAINRKTIYLGCYATEEEAHQAYLAGKRKYHSETCSHY